MKKSIIPLIIFAGILTMGILSCNDAGVFVNTTTVSMRVDTAGQDAIITDYDSSGNFGSESHFAAVAWGIGGQYHARSLIKFNILNYVPESVTVTSAVLHLRFNSQSYNGLSPGHYPPSGDSNGCYLKRITSNWSASTVTWNLRPGTTDLNQATLGASTSSDQNYDVDVTAMVDDIVNRRTANYGFMLILQYETGTRWLSFASGEYIGVNDRPVLEINYKK